LWLYLRIYCGPRHTDTHSYSHSALCSSLKHSTSSIQYPASLALRPLGWSRTTRGASSKPRLEPEHAPNLKLGLKLRLNLNLKLKLNLKPGRGNQNAIENETGAAMPATEREKLYKTIQKLHIIGLKMFLKIITMCVAKIFIFHLNDWHMKTSFLYHILIDKLLKIL